MPVHPPTTGTQVWRWEVEPEYVGERIDKAIPQYLKDRAAEGPSEEEDEGPVAFVVPANLSRSQLQALIESGKVLLNGRALTKSPTLKSGDVVEVSIDPPRVLDDVTPVNLPLEILFEDEHLVFVNKPPGISVHPSETESGPTLVHVLLHHIKDLSGIGGRLRPGIVHRLDKLTSGVMVVSKTDEAHQKLVAAFSAHAHERQYWALTYGAPELWGSHEKKIITKIGRDPKDRKKMSAEVKEGREAITIFRCPEKFRIGKLPPFAGFIEANLHTGRTHQVRVHLLSLNHSILGDPIYGKPGAQQPKWKNLPEPVQELVAALPGQALHARVLGIVHPITGEKIRIEAEPPPAFRALLDTLRNYR